jgi:hypothetical protein
VTTHLLDVARMSLGLTSLQVAMPPVVLVLAPRGHVGLYVPLPLSSNRAIQRTCGQRSDRNAARSSAANSSGSSHAAKWPPRSASPK